MRTIYASLALFACGPTPAAPVATVEGRSSLRVALAQGDVDVVGVTLEPETGERFVLDSGRGLYQLHGDGSTLIRKVVQMTSLERPVLSAFTDVAALGDGRFAITALNDGFLLDTEEGTFEPYFCYLPDQIVDEYAPTPIVQMTNAVAYDQERDIMYAQPQTLEWSPDGRVLRSQIGQFASTGGEGFGWMEISDEDFVAGGLAPMGGDALLLGRGSELRIFDLAGGDLGDAIDLADRGITSIQGLAKVPGSDRVLLIDGASDELVELSVSKVER